MPPTGVRQEKNSLSIDDHCARPAMPEAATEFRAVELEVVAQDVEKRRRRIGIELMWLAVDRDRDS